MQEKFSYICPDIAKEFAKYDKEPDKWFKTYEGVNSVTKKVTMPATLVNSNLWCHYSHLWWT